MKASGNFKLIGISMLIIVGLVACGKQGSATVADSAANPDEFLQHLVSTNAVVLGTKDGETTPSYQISFSNGYMMYGSRSGQVKRGSTPNATCVFFTFPSYGGDAQIELCMTVLDFQTRGVALKKGDLYIQDGYPDLSGGIYRAHVK